MKKFVLRLAALLGCIVLLLMVALLIISPQETKSFIEQDGGIAENSIAEIRDVEINGVTQRLLIRGLNRNNPLLLHVHGGPGGADQAIVRSSQLQRLLGSTRCRCFVLKLHADGITFPITNCDRWCRTLKGIVN